MLPATLRVSFDAGYQGQVFSKFADCIAIRKIGVKLLAEDLPPDVQQKILRSRYVNIVDIVPWAYRSA